jgi:exodeoxyribonuclease-3
VAIYSKREPDEVRTALGWAPFDDEGRYIEARYGNLSVVSFYIPSGSSGDLRQGFKFEVMEWLKPVLDQWLASGRDYVLCGDWNIVRSAGHQELEVQPEEFRLPAARARWLNAQIGADGGSDDTPQPASGKAGSMPTARCIPGGTTPGGATAVRRGPTTSVGASTTSSPPGARQARAGCSICREPRFSDHAPFTVDYAVSDAASAMQPTSYKGWAGIRAPSARRRRW